MGKKYKTIIISDVHLWKPNNLSEKLICFLRSITFDSLILNWDIIDFWQLATFGKWTEKEKIFIDFVNELIHQWINVTYVYGNHDKSILSSHGLCLHKMNLVKDLFYSTSNKRTYYICHWEMFDFINTHLVFLGKIANFFYSLLFLLETSWNKNTYKVWYRPLSERIKMYFKKKFFPKKRLQKKVFNLVNRLGCDWMVLGHYHLPDYVKKWTKEYFNTGDRISSCTAVVENEGWFFELLYYI